MQSRSLQYSIVQLMLELAVCSAAAVGMHCTNATAVKCYTASREVNAIPRKWTLLSACYC